MSPGAQHFEPGEAEMHLVVIILIDSWGKVSGKASKDKGESQAKPVDASRAFQSILRPARKITQFPVVLFYRESSR
jgi:hypothetical protein